MTRSNMLKGLLVSTAAIALLGGTTATGAMEPEKQSRGIRNIVLVHGAWADGSSWSRVIPLLQADGLHPNAQGVALIVRRMLPSVTASLKVSPAARAYP